MTLTIDAFSIELFLFHSLHIKAGEREWYFKREPQNPRGFFSRQSEGSHSGAGVEVWGLGWYGCWNRA